MKMVQYCHFIQITLISLVISGSLLVFSTIEGSESIDPVDGIFEEKIMNSAIYPSDNYFIKNTGQIEDKILFYSNNENVLFTKNEMYFFFNLSNMGISKRANDDIFILKYSFIEANNITPIGRSICPWKTNYLIGNDSTKWNTNVPSYYEIEFNDLWEGIDLIYRYDSGLIKYDIKMHPGADPERIKIKVEGQDRLYLEPNGDLQIDTPFGVIKDTNLIVHYSDGGEIRCRFTLLDGNTYAFLLDGYDRKKEIIIDPLIVYSTFIGPWIKDNLYWAGIDIDNEGNSFTISTFSFNSMFYYRDYIQSNILGVCGDYRYNRTSFVIVNKINRDGSSLIYSTILGGSYGDNCGSDIVIDDMNCAYITGITDSYDFPITPDAFDTEVFHTDAFISKLTSNGSALVYSTFLGGTGLDGAHGIDLDDLYNAYITGYTNKGDFQVTDGAFDTTFDDGDVGPEDINAFVSKFGPTGALIYSTFFGCKTSGFSIKVDTDRTAIVTGYVKDSVPASSESFDETFNGDSDSFLFKLSSDGSSLVFCTYLGGKGLDYGRDVDLDKDHYIYVIGLTNSSDFPVTNWSVGNSYNGKEDGFYAKFGPYGKYIFSTFIGGNGNDTLTGISLDSNSNAYMIGYTDSKDLPKKENSFNVSFSEYGQDVFLTVVNSNGTSLGFSSYIGGGFGLNIKSDQDEYIYLIGHGEDKYYPVTENVFRNNTSYNGTVLDSFFITKILFKKTIPYIMDQSIDHGTTGETFEITADVRDPYGISGVYLSYRFGNREKTTISILKNDDHFRTKVKIPFDSLAKLHYTISAVSNIGIWNQTEERTIDIRDNDPPIFINYTNSDQVATGDKFRFSAEVIDNIGLSNVTVEYWFDQMDHYNVSMDLDDGEYSFQIDVPLNSMNSLYYIFRAGDTSGNWNCTIQKKVTVFDNLLPMFGTDLTPDSVGTGDPALFSIEVTDNIGISGVTVEYLRMSIDHKIVNMSGSGRYTYEIRAPIDSIETINYIFVATDSNLNRINVSGSIVVKDTISPIARIEIPQIVNEDEPIVLDGSDSSDNIGIVYHIWKVIKGEREFPLNGEKVNFTFDHPMEYTIMLKVIDGEGNTDIETIQINAKDLTPPVAYAGSDILVEMGTNVIFNGSGSVDNVGITSWSWTFQDKDLNIVFCEMESEYNFEKPGIYEVMLTVMDAALNIGRDYMMVSVMDSTRPVANAGPDQTVVKGTNVILNGSQSHDNYRIVEWIWTFFYAGSNNTRLGEIVEHIFTYPGNFTVYLTVSDESGNIDTDMIIINVEDKNMHNEESFRDQGTWFQWWMLLIPVTTFEIFFIIFIYIRKRKKGGSLFSKYE